MKSGKVFKTEKYYLFWGICTVAVVLGQVYVASGYRQMSNSILDVIETWKRKTNGTSHKQSEMQSSFKLIEKEKEEGYYNKNLKI